jgi:4'-phosphopantetheinyl transferase
MMPAPSLWSPPPQPLGLASDEVHVWRARLDVIAAQVEALAQTLAADERARAQRFHAARDRTQYIVARGLLRAILGRYLDEQPDRLRFCYSPHGKPALAEEQAANALRFNVSHAHGMALYAITRGREIGIDLEHIRADVTGEDIAARFFAPREVGMLQALPAHRRLEAFLTLWTRKEAYVKARGDGLSLDLTRFDVSRAIVEPAARVTSDAERHDLRRWSLRDLAPGPGYVAALAVEGHGWQLRCWYWPVRTDG